MGLGGGGLESQEDQKKKRKGVEVHKGLEQNKVHNKTMIERGGNLKRTSRRQYATNEKDKKKTLDN